MCGNPFAALRQRKRQHAPTPQPKTTNKEDVFVPVKSKSDTSASQFKPERSYLSKEDEGKMNHNKEDVFEALRNWRLNNQA